MEELGELRADLAEVVDAVALPADAEMYFADVDGGGLPVESQIDAAQSGALEEVAQALDRVGDDEIYIVMANQGNLIEIEAEIRRQEYQGVAGEGVSEWQRIARAVLAIRELDSFHSLRATTLQPLAAGESNATAEMIAAAKREILSIYGVPPGVRADDISWDAISFKVPPSAAEYFVQRYPLALETMKDQLSLVDVIERTVYATINEKCVEYRNRSETVQDEFLPDVSIFLESQLVEKVQYARSEKIKSMGRAVLAKYVDRMQGLFATGNLPGAIPPAKIYACHDVKSAVELRLQIQTLAEKYVAQQAELMTNRNIRKAINDFDAAGNGIFTDAQYQSMQLKSNVDRGLAAGMSSMGAKFNDPRRDLVQQLAGGSNSMIDQMDVSTGGEVMRLTEGEEYLLRQQVSLLLACLRVRAGASQASTTELVSDEDFDHFEIVKELSQTAAMTADDTVFRTALTTSESYMFGHNRTKFADHKLPPELVDLINYSVNGRAKMILKTVPVFSADIQEGGQLFSLLMNSVYKSLALRTRIQTETEERVAKRAAYSYVSYV